MPIPLTSQEKKVLGFISFLVILGSLVLFFRHFTPDQAPGRAPAVSAVPK